MARAPTGIYTLSLHDALPISRCVGRQAPTATTWVPGAIQPLRSEEHTSELQSRQYLVCRLLLEKKKPLRGDDLPELLHATGQRPGNPGFRDAGNTQYYPYPPSENIPDLPG